ncbi:MAG: mechanosensitive ion channel family protein [Cyanobacteria bacterium J06554_6]
MLQSLLDLTSSAQEKLIASGLGLLLVLGLRLTVMRLVNRQVEDPRERYTWRKSVSYVSIAISLVLVVGPWLPAIGSLSTFLGFTTAGLTVALREPIVDVVGWIFLLWRQPFQVGDRIEIGVHAGDVIDIRTFQFTLMEVGNWVESDQSTGRIIHVPNSWVFQQAVANYSKGFQYIWNEIPVLITFESDWEKAKSILTTIANEHAAARSEAAQTHLRQAAKKYLIFYSKLTPIVYTSVRDSGVLLTIRYLCEPRQRRGNEQEKWEAILKAFAQEPDIHFAYPTQRFYTESPTSVLSPNAGHY